MIMKTKIVALGLVLLFVILMIWSGSVPLGKMVVDDVTKAYKYPSSGEDCPVRGSTYELCARTFSITAWHNTEGTPNSIPMTFTGRCIWPYCDGGILHSPYVPWKYYYKVSMIESESGTPTVLMNWNTYNSNIVHIVSAPQGWTSNNLMFYWPTSSVAIHQYSNLCPIYIDGVHTNDTWDKGFVHSDCAICWFNCCDSSLVAEPFEIELKGYHIGKLIIEFYAMVGDEEFGGIKYHNILLQSDEVKLLPGDGGVSVRASNEWDGHYIFEKGDTVYFDVFTSYSGVTAGGEYANDRWVLKLFNNFGVKVYEWVLPDEFRGSRAYVLNDVEYNPDGQNIWRVELWNNLFMQHEEDFFITIFERMPSITTITFSKTSYNQGETVQATLKANGNVNGTNQVYEFYAKAYYQGTTNYLFDAYVRASSSGVGNEYKATISFTAALSNTIVEVVAWAFDKSHTGGGLAGPRGIATVYIKDPSQPGTYVLNLYVKDGNTQIPISNAKIDCPQANIYNEYTDINGVYILRQLVNGEYKITVSKEGYNTKTVSVYIASADKTETVYLTSGDIWTYIIPIVIFLLFLIGAIVVKPMNIRILLIILGIAISIITYLFLSGII